MEDILIIQNRVNENKTYEIKKRITDQKQSLCDFIAPHELNPLLNGYYASDEIIVCGTIPYIISGGSIKWNVNRFDVTIEEFIDTHPRCLSDGINVDIGFPMAGGVGRVAADVAVDIFIETICINYPQLGLSLFALKKLTGAIVSLKNYFTEKNITPKEQLDALNNNEAVSPYVIMEILDYDDYHARQYLESLGFYKDKKTGKYKINEINKQKARAIIRGLDDRNL